MKIASVILVCILASPTFAQEITVAAAADLHAALDEIATHYKAETSAPVKIVYGSSGNLYQQIQNGAPFDVFFSANTDYPEKLEAALKVQANTHGLSPAGYVRDILERELASELEDQPSDRPCPPCEVILRVGAPGRFARKPPR